MRLNRDFAALVILLVALLLGACQPAVTPTPIPPTEENEAIARRVLEEIWNQGNLAVVDELYASNFVYRNPSLPEKVTTHEGYKQFVAGVRTDIPDWHVTVEDMVAGGDTVVARWAGGGTHEPTGKQVTMSGVNIYHIAGGKIVDDWTELDLLSLLIPIGAVPPPGQAEANKAIARRVLEEVWSQGDLSVVDELYASDFVYRNPGLPEVVTTHEGYKEFVAGVRTDFPDWHVTVEDMAAEGDTVVAQWTGGATDQTGKQVTMSGVNIYHIEGGKIVDDWTELDMLSLMIQIGAIPPPGAAAAPELRLATSPEDIVGTWFNLVVPFYFQFNQDGTSRGAFTLDQLEDQPIAVGEFWFEGTQFFWRDLEASGVPICESIAIYEVELLENGNLSFKTIEDDCVNRRSTFQGVYEPIR